MKNDVTFIVFIILNDKPFSKFTNVKKNDQNNIHLI